ncbi:MULTISPECIES: universal stress protein [unclassified Leucobacter]|uniref:universal stress protein n=1 Tax=unclassified Leucobacter TaxID=2621730 RepID=UPI00165E1219|nr:universal stress protein [Leucobacter sp. cx-87]
MSIVVGVAPGHSTEAAVHLGVLLARSYREDLVIASVIAQSWPPSRQSKDPAYQQALRERAEAAIAAARAVVPEDIVVTEVVANASSARKGLLQVSEEHHAVRLVVGASRDAEHGQLTLGSISQGLLQSAHLPVAIAPHGFTIAAHDRLSRITAAYSGSETSGELILGAAAIAADAGVGIRIASFAMRPQAITTAAIGLDIQDEVIEEWESVIRAHTDELLGAIADLSRQPVAAEVSVGVGGTWGEAMRSIEWLENEVLLVGSSSLGALARVSLGSHATKILRHSPVPVVVVPRKATEAYAAQVDTLSSNR